MSLPIGPGSSGPPGFEVTSGEAGPVSPAVGVGTEGVVGVGPTPGGVPVVSLPVGVLTPGIAPVSTTPGLPPSPSTPIMESLPSSSATQAVASTTVADRTKEDFADVLSLRCAIDTSKERATASERNRSPKGCRKPDRVDETREGWEFSPGNAGTVGDRSEFLARSRRWNCSRLDSE